MPNFKMIDEDIINNYINNYKIRLSEINKKENKTENDINTKHNISMAIVNYLSIKSLFIDLDNRFGMTRDYELGPGYVVWDFPPDFESMFGYMNEDPEEDEALEKSAYMNNVNLRVIDLDDIEITIDRVAKGIIEVNNETDWGITDNKRIRYSSLNTQLHTLIQIRDSLESLSPHIEDAFKAGVACADVDDYDPEIYRYKLKMGYEALE